MWLELTGEIISPRIKLMVLFRFFSFITILFIFLATPTLVFGDDPATLKDLETVFGSIISIVAIIGGFLAFIAIIIGGFKYITARGDPKAVAGAQSTLTWAFIGLALIIMAWLILVFINELTGIPVTTFTIPF